MAALNNGEYLIEVNLTGGSGKATVTSPAHITVDNDKVSAEIEWSSPNYDYMEIGGIGYSPVNKSGNSVFEVAVDALDVSSAAGHEDVVAVGRAFDVNLRKELMDSGRFFVCDADDRSPSAQKIVPQYRFTGKLSRLAVDEGGAELTLSAAVADVSTGQVVWSKKESVGKRSPLLPTLRRSRTLSSRLRRQRESNWSPGAQFVRPSVAYS